jgi:hypothetical protein
VHKITCYLSHHFQVALRLFVCVLRVMHPPKDSSDMVLSFWATQESMIAFLRHKQTLSLSAVLMSHYESYSSTTQ